MVTIKVLDTLDWGCAATREDVAAYEQAVADAISARYPEATVEVSCEQRGVRSITVDTGDGDSPASWDREAEIRDAVACILQGVWDDGTFWVSVRDAIADDVFPMFTLRINLGNAAMQTTTDVAEALRAVARKLDAGHAVGGIRDLNGNAVGEFSGNFEPEEEKVDEEEAPESEET